MLSFTTRPYLNVQAFGDCVFLICSSLWVQDLCGHAGKWEFQGVATSHNADQFVEHRKRDCCGRLDSYFWQLMQAAKLCTMWFAQLGHAHHIWNFVIFEILSDFFVLKKNTLLVTWCCSAGARYLNVGLCLLEVFVCIEISVPLRVWTNTAS